MAIWLRNFDYTFYNGKVFYKDKEISLKRFNKVKRYYRIIDTIISSMFGISVIILCILIGLALNGTL